MVVVVVAEQIEALRRWAQTRCDGGVDGGMCSKDVCLRRAGT